MIEGDDARAPLPPVLPSADPHRDESPSRPVHKHEFFADLYAATARPAIVQSGPPQPEIPYKADEQPDAQAAAEPLWRDRRDDGAGAPTPHNRDSYGPAGGPASGLGSLGDPSVSLALADRRRVPLSRRLLIPVLAVAAVVAVVVVLVTVVFGAGDAAGPEQMDGGDQTSSGVAAVDARYVDELRAVIPGGFPESSCLAVAPGAAGVLAQIECGPYPGGGGPERAVYQRADGSGRLSELLASAQDVSTVRVCPGRIQSPGPWRRGGVPERSGGIVFCGERAGQPMMGWSDDEQMTFALISSGDGGSTPEQLYRWWSANS